MRDLGQMIEPLTDDERQYIESLIDKVGRRMIRSKRCWANSQRMLMEDDENRLCYWECSLPIPHAWVTINGKIVDVTYEAGVVRLSGYNSRCLHTIQNRAA